MKTKCFVVLVLVVLVSLGIARAIMIGDYHGLKKLIDSADAIVILRVERDLSDFDSPTLYSMHECFIYQTLKGDIAEGTRIKLQLMDPETDFATPYAHGSTHLMFLRKKANEDEPTEYRTMAIRGAQVLLSPLGHEKEPEGKTVEEKVRSIIKDAIAYQTRVHEKREKFLKSMLDDGKAAEQKAESDGE